MALLNDVRNIIKPITTIDYTTFNQNLDNILENLIIHNNTIYNSYMFNHIIYNTNNELKDIFITILSKHINSYIKNQRNHFRNLNKKNKLDIKDFNNFFDECYKLINKLNGMFQHIIPNNSNKSVKCKWGDSELWNILIKNITNILLDDVIFKYAITNNIKKLPSTEKNPDIFKLHNYLLTFFQYIPTINFTHHIIIMDEAFIDIIDNNINNIDIDVYKFKRVYKYYMDYYVNYYYITKDYELLKFKEYLTNCIKKIFENNNIAYIKNVITIYKKEFISLMKHINFSNILLSFPINDINSYISYYNTLYEITKQTNLESIVIDCIKENNLKYFKTFEDVSYLADLINTDILNSQINDFYYILGYYCNKDEFIMAICQKLMERIIYTYSNNIIEINHQTIFSNIFKFKEPQNILKYNTIRNDYIESIKLWNSSFENQNNFKLIITSLDAWKINHSIGYSDTIINTEEFTTLLCNKMFQYNDMNKSTEINKKIIVYPHLGCVEIEIYNKKITVLPAHMLCLELFVSFDTNLMYDLIFNKMKQSMSNYSNDFIKSIIDSLIGPILIKMTNDLLRVRTDIQEINMIDIFYNNNHKLSIIKEMKEELVHNKIDIIMTNINHFIKQFEQINIDTLYDLVSINIKLFKVNKDYYKEAIDKLVKNDYIDINKDNYIKKIIYG